MPEFVAAQESVPGTFRTSPDLQIESGMRVEAAIHRPL